MPDLTPASPRPPSRLGLYLPFAILALVCLVWSGFWYFAVSKTNEILDQTLMREARAGRDWTCPNRSVSGFPFRIQLTCSAPTFISRVEGREASGSLGALQIQARAIEPTRGIATLTGPLLLKTGNGSAEVNWKSAQTSVATDTTILNEFDIDIQDMTISLMGGGEQPLLGGVHRFTLALVQDGPKSEKTADYKIGSKIEGFTFAPLDAASGNSSPLNLELQGIIAKAPLVPQKDWRNAVEDWRQAGGALKIILFDLVKGPMHLGLKGDVGLDESHRTNGKLEAAFQGLDTIAAQFGARNLAGFVKSGKLPMLMTNGKLYIGPLPVLNLAPVY